MTLLDLRDSHVPYAAHLTDFILEGKGAAAAERWETIRNAAVRAFYRSTYPATTIRAVAEEAGVTSAALYYYVETKDDLLFSIVHKVHNDGLRKDIEAPVRSDSPLVMIRAVVQKHIESTLENWAETAVATENLRFLRRDRQDLILAIRRRREEWVAEMVELGVQRGEFKISGPPRLVAISILSSLNAIAVWYRPSRSWSPDTILSMYDDLVIRGLLGTEHQSLER